MQLPNISEPKRRGPNMFDDRKSSNASSSPPAAPAPGPVAFPAMALCSSPARTCPAPLQPCTPPPPPEDRGLQLIWTSSPFLLLCLDELLAPSLACHGAMLTLGDRKGCEERPDGGERRLLRASLGRRSEVLQGRRGG
eukprot:199575-Hanusia_phi.AAC.1